MKKQSVFFIFLFIFEGLFSRVSLRPPAPILSTPSAPPRFSSSGDQRRLESGTDRHRCDS